MDSINDINTLKILVSHLYDELSLKNLFLKITNRNLKITSFMLNKKFFVYTGKKFILINVNESMLGHTLGEYCFSKQILVKKPKKRYKNK